jgi:hypothetical protein
LLFIEATPAIFYEKISEEYQGMRLSWLYAQEEVIICSEASSMPSKTIMQSLVLLLRHLWSLSHACVVWFFQLVPLAAYVLALSHACSLSFKMCKKAICCVVTLGLTHLESNIIANHVMYNTITVMTGKLHANLLKPLV